MSAINDPQSKLRTYLPLAVFLYGLFAAAVFAFVFYGRQSVMEANVDLNGFGQLARNIASGEGFTLGQGPTTRRAPLFPYVAAALLTVFGDVSNANVPEAELYRPLLVANCIYFGLTCLVIWRLGRKLFGPRAALLAVAIAPLVPQSLRYVGMTEVETLMGLFIALLALTGVNLANRPSPKSGIAFGAVAALATLTKPVVMLYPFAFLPVAAFFWWRRRTPPATAALAAGAVLVCFGLLLLPWSLRNAQVTQGKFRGISSNGSGEFLRGYINAQPKYYLLRQDFGGTGPGEKWDPEANLYEEAFLKSHGLIFYRYGRVAGGHLTMEPKPPAGTTSAMIELEKDHVEDAEMKRRILHEPGAFLAKFAAQLGTFWYIVETRNKSLFVGSIALVMLVFAGLGVAHAVRRRMEVWPVVLVLLYSNAIYAAFLALARYSMPLYPTIAVLSAGGALWLADRLFGRRLLDAPEPSEAAVIAPR